MKNRESNSSHGLESEGKSEQEMIREIIDNKTRDEGEEDGDHETAYRLSCGMKDMILRLDQDIKSAFTFVENVRDESFSQDDETTLLYKAASEVMHDFANEEGSPIEYKFMTDVESMEAWAKNQGREIFNWTDEYDSGDGAFNKIFETEIQPDNPADEDPTN